MLYEEIHFQLKMGKKNRQIWIEKLQQQAGCSDVACNQLQH